MYFDPQAFLELLTGRAFHQSTPWVIWGFAFLAGVVSSVLPCALSVTPLMVSYLTQAVCQEVTDTSPPIPAQTGYAGKSRSVWQILSFIVGSACTLSVLGVLSTAGGWVFGSWLNPYTYTVLALVCFAMAGSVAGYWTLSFPQCMAFTVPESLRTGASQHPLGAFVLGLLFGVIGSPCATPFLVGVLSFMSTTQQWVVAGIALWCYAFGRGMPILCMALGCQTVPMQRWLLMHHQRLTLLAGFALGLLGLGLLYEGWRTVLFR
ncbi:MAG: cytochrome c biogenesis CcdA family protein [Vampirovibrionales bacterium]